MAIDFLEFIFDTFAYWVESEVTTTGAPSTSGTQGTSGGGGGSGGGTRPKPRAPLPVVWMTQAQADHLSAVGRAPSVNYADYIGADPVDLAKFSKGPKMPPAARTAKAVIGECTSGESDCVGVGADGGDSGGTCMTNRPGGTVVDNTSGRANGAEACIDKRHDKFDTKAVRPANWVEAVAKTKNLMELDEEDDNPLASCHNIPAVIGGSNTNTANLTPCVNIGTNISGYSMRWIEAFSVAFADAGFTVGYRVVDDYNSGTSTIPNGYSYTIKIWLDAGSPPITFIARVDNAYDDGGDSVNIGN